MAFLTNIMTSGWKTISVMESSEYRSVCLGLTWQWNCYLKNKSNQEASTYTFNKKKIIQIHIASQLVGTPKLHVACRVWLIIHAVMHQFFSYFHVRCQKVTELQYHSPCLYVTKQCSTTSHLALGIRWLRTKGCIYT